MSKFFLYAVYEDKDGNVIEARGINPRSDVYDKKESYTKLDVETLETKETMPEPLKKVSSF